MTDTNDMRREFDAWLNSSKAVNGYDSDLFHAWQAATERATALERERCAAVCDALVDVATAKKAFKNVQETRGKGGFVENSALKFDLTVGHCNRMIEKCAAAIRQGGAA